MAMALRTERLRECGCYNVSGHRHRAEKDGDLFQNTCHVVQEIPSAPQKDRQVQVLTRPKYLQGTGYE